MALTSRHTIRCINEVLTASLMMDIDGSSVKAHRYADKLLHEGWEIFVVDQHRGRCYYGKKLVLIPAWAYNSLSPRTGKHAPGYSNYYLAHELAHAKSMLEHGVEVANHGKEFMEAFRSLCDPKNWHYELGYKPQNAAKAGIMVIPEDF